MNSPAWFAPSFLAAGCLLGVFSCSQAATTTTVGWGLNDHYVTTPQGQVVLAECGQATPPPGLTNAVSVAGGQFSSLALKDDGTVAAWGDNQNGETNVPVGLTNVVAVAPGLSYALALRRDGTLAVWGTEWPGTVTNIPPGLSNGVAVAAGFAHSLVVRADGTVVSWGDTNFMTQDLGQTIVPSGLSNVVAVAAGVYHSVALRSDGTVVAWGDNTVGETNVPSGLTNAVAIASWAGFHTLALKADGTVVGWGENDDGQTNVPAGLNSVVAIACGAYHSVALRTDGTVVAWGAGSDGQTNVPPGLTNAVAIGCGGYHCLAVCNDGSAFVARQPYSQTVPAGMDVTLNVGAAGVAPLDYQWQFQGTNIDGATNAFLTLTHLPANRAGDYRCVVSNALGSATSAPAKVAVLRGIPRFDTSPGAMQFTNGGLGLSLTGLSGAGPVIIQASTNLQDWTPIFTNPPVLGTLRFVDPAALNSPARFYRAIEQ